MKNINIQGAVKMLSSLWITTPSFSSMWP